MTKIDRLSLLLKNIERLSTNESNADLLVSMLKN